MTDLSPSPATEEPSRRDLVAAAVTVAAVAGAASSAQTQAHAQGKADVRYSNPPGMSSPPAYSHVVESTGHTAQSILPARPAPTRPARLPRGSVPRRCK